MARDFIAFLIDAQKDGTLGGWFAGLDADKPDAADKLYIYLHDTRGYTDVTTDDCTRIVQVKRDLNTDHRKTFELMKFKEVTSVPLSY